MGRMVAISPDSISSQLNNLDGKRMPQGRTLIGSARAICPPLEAVSVGVARSDLGPMSTSVVESTFCYRSRQWRRKCWASEHLSYCGSLWML